MKSKLAKFALVVVLCVGGANAGKNKNTIEIHKNAIGLRLATSGALLGGELNYQKGMNKSNLLEFGLAYNLNSTNSYLSVIGFYLWHWGIKGLKGVGWYIGPGVDFGAANLFNLGNDSYSGSLSYSAAGEVGVVYDLNVSKTPLLLSLDLRPKVGLAQNKYASLGVGAGIRYTF